MKSVISTGLVAALLLPSSVTAGSCPKFSHGSNRITCHMFIDHSEVVKGKAKTGGFGGLFGGWGGGKKNKGLTIRRRTTTFAWSFFWKYIAADDCPKTRAHLTSILPPLGPLPHAVKCKVEVRWTPDKDHDKCEHSEHDLFDPYNDHGCNVTWDFAGDSLIDHFSLPAKMVWPLTASYDRPSHHFKSNDFNIKHDLANEGDQFNLQIHSGHGNDFSHSWGKPVGGFIGFLDEQHKEKEFEEGDKKDKRGDKDKKEKEKDLDIKKDHAKFHGFYNTKNLYSCWVFDKFHVETSGTIKTGKKGKKGKRADEDKKEDLQLDPKQGLNGLDSKDLEDPEVKELLLHSLHHLHLHLPTWSSCHPRPPVPCHEEQKCEGDSCKLEEQHASDHGSKERGSSSGSDSGSDSEVSESFESCAQLEWAVAAGVTILDELISELERTQSVSDTTQWVRRCKELLKKADTRRTVIGVTGSTGSGKSSIINALLDEENLLPTNCMRACTAVSVEVAYNDSNLKEERYRAEVEFISFEEMANELRILLSDVRSESDGEARVPRLASDTPAGIAYAKSSRKELSDELRKYIDSDLKHQNTAKTSGTMKYWPLVKVVRIFVKAEILKDRVVIVDLPGVQDSNAARSAVASNYVDHCSGHWVVSPITRAVNDKVAYDLMGKAFRRQLQLVGMYSNVTIVCSKTDDFCTKEILEDSSAESEPRRIWDQVQRLEEEERELCDETSRMERRSKNLRKTVKQLRTDIKKLQEETGSSKAMVSTPGSLKRASFESPQRMSKRLRVQRDDSGTFIKQESEDEFRSEVEAGERLAELQEKKASLSSEFRRISEEQKDVAERLKTCQAKINELAPVFKQACVRYRNEWVRPTVQRDFAEGLKDLDQDPEAEQDDGKCDYTAIANNLPVFCVSSRAYHKRSSRYMRDAVEGFISLEDTGIPALKDHVKRVGESSRLAACLQFLEDLHMLLQELYLQASADADRAAGPAEELRRTELSLLTNHTATSIATRKANHIMRLRDHRSDLGLAIQAASKVFDRHISDSMRPIYRWCADQRGKGCFNRMKNHMEKEVQELSLTVFDDMVSRVKNDLNIYMNGLEKRIKATVDEGIQSIKSAYLAVLADESNFEAPAKARQELIAILLRADCSFVEILHTPETSLPGSGLIEWLKEEEDADSDSDEELGPDEDMDEDKDDGY
ncbi:hypothetical protein VTJ49DRAFT_1802 [Mycothermus thermophilus]|uniref:Dynamin N-terminal domain-containing protein n=1 Tax=Humicola insolens TaxID=85995 RepID=A0ABR3VBG9_HUMIN